MAQPLRLFVRTGDTVRGPLSVRTLRKLVETGEMDQNSNVSLDGRKWIPAASVRGLLSMAPQVATRVGAQAGAHGAPLRKAAGAESSVLEPVAAAPMAATASSVVATVTATPVQSAPRRRPATPASTASTSTASTPVASTSAASGPAGTRAAHASRPPLKLPTRHRVDPAERARSATSATQPQLRRILGNVQAGMGRLRWLFPVLLTGAFLLVAGAVFAVGQAAVGLFGAIPLWLRVAVAAPPAVLLGGALAHAAGNAALGAICGIQPAERRCLALHLPWRRTPSTWPSYFCRWLYCGDWLLDRESVDILPYVRGFITGAPPATIEEELDLWVSLLHNTRRANVNDMEIGRSVRELACVEKLPSWTRELDPGTDLPDLEAQLGTVGHDWAVSLLTRASHRMKIFGNIDPRGDLHEVGFEFHYCEMENDREGLLVILRPRLDHPSQAVLESRSELAA